MYPNSERVPADSIFEKIRNRICLLDYPPGTILREAELAAEFGVSRTPIRSVIQQLTHCGLVESKDGVGTLVTELNFSEIRDIYCMRIKIAECIGQMNPCKITAEIKVTAHELQQRASLLTKKFNIVDYWLINHDQHNLIAGIIGNSALRQMWNHFYFLVVRIWYEFARTDPQNVAETLVSEISEVARALDQDSAIALGLVQSNYISYGLAKLEKRHLESKSK
ncbi:MAG: DNA-binding GntR family transcriptional regulator [Gammaproteobacteria bacterium]|jgi:DNA-binding GntR family transcriptional regulator